MAETLLETKITNENSYGITPEIREEYRLKLDRMIKEQGIKAAKTGEDLYRYADESGQTPEEIQTEVDKFLRMREERRERAEKLTKDCE